MSKIGLVSCSQLKHKGRLPASRLYCSSYFRAALREAQRQCDVVLILSAKYGVVLPDEVIESYDLSLTELTGEQRCELKGRVHLWFRESGLLAPGNLFFSFLSRSYGYLVSFLSFSGGKKTVSNVRWENGGGLFHGKDAPLIWIMRMCWQYGRLPLSHIREEIRLQGYRSQTVKCQLQFLCHSPFLSVKGWEVFYDYGKAGGAMPGCGSCRNLSLGRCDGRTCPPVAERVIGEGFGIL